MPDVVSSHLYPLNVLCLASLQQGPTPRSRIRRLGCRVYLLTLSLKEKCDLTPPESLDEIFSIPDRDHQWNLTDVIKAVNHLARRIATGSIMARRLGAVDA